MGEQPFKVDNCQSCHAPIIWAITEKKLRRMPVDAEPPTKGGNIELVVRAKGVAAPIARVLNPTQQFGKTGLRTSHFATCKYADRHRLTGKNRPTP